MNIRLVSYAKYIFIEFFNEFPTNVFLHTLPTEFFCVRHFSSKFLPSVFVAPNLRTVQFSGLLVFTLSCQYEIVPYRIVMPACRHTRFRNSFVYNT